MTYSLQQEHPIMKIQKHFKKVSLFPLSFTDNRLLFRFYHCGSCYLFASNISQSTSLRTNLGDPLWVFDSCRAPAVQEGWERGRGGRNILRYSGRKCYGSAMTLDSGWGLIFEGFRCCEFFDLISTADINV